MQKSLRGGFFQILLCFQGLLFALIVCFRGFCSGGSIRSFHGGKLLCGGFGIGIGGVDLLGLGLVVVVGAGKYHHLVVLTQAHHRPRRKGIRNYDAAKDKVAAVKIVDDVDDVLLSSQEGIIIRLHANEIPLQSRYGSGVRVMRLGENDKVMVLARTDHDDEAQTEKIDASEADAEPTAEQLAEMEAADAAAATEAPEADPEEKE